jgi:hypothetical protein
MTGLSQYKELYTHDYPEANLPDAFVEKPIQQEKVLEIVRTLIS